MNKWNNVLPKIIIILISIMLIGNAWKLNNIIEKNKLLKEEIGQVTLENENYINRIGDLENTLIKLEDDNLELKNKIKRKEEEIKKERKKSSRGDSSRGKLLGTFEATAYTDNVQSQGKWVGQTATGVKPQVGVIAVDPEVISLGSKVIVEGYNNNKPVICADTGGAIKGNKIDVFKNTQKECVNWGRKNVKIWLIK